jgi:hypothetical protein
MNNDGDFEKLINEKPNHLNQLTDNNILFFYLLSILLFSFILINLYIFVLV